jgi:hypothetical protein
MYFVLIGVVQKGCTNCTTIWKPPQNSRRQKGGGHEASSVLRTCGRKNKKLKKKKEKNVSRHGELATGIFEPQ